MAPCMLCPKMGGALKPTNIFQSKEKYQKYNKSSTKHKKKGYKEPDDQFEDKNLSLQAILKKEFDY